MNALEADGDLLAACRFRQSILDDLEHAEHQLDRAVLAKLIGPGDHFLTVLNATSRSDELLRLLNDVTNAIAEAVMEHLLNPPPVRDQIAVLPMARRA